MQQLEAGAIVEGKVTGITKFGVFVDIGDGKTGMVHISEVASTFVENISDHLTMGQQVKVKVITVGEDGKIGLSIKRAQEQPREKRQFHRRQPSPAPDRPTGAEWRAKSAEPMSFEDMMSRFKTTSDDKMSDLKRKNNGEMRRQKRAPK